MARLDIGFTADELPESRGDYEPLPEGWYSAEIGDAEIRVTKDGTGQYIRCRYNVTGPTKAGRVVFGNLNIMNKSQKAEEIGRQQLGELMRSIGLGRIEDTDQLIGCPLQIKLSIRPAENGYAAQNDVRGFRAPEGAAPAKAAPAASGATSGKAAPPWAKK
jgi:Protein of unknown function (DUF669)